MVQSKRSETDLNPKSMMTRLQIRLLGGATIRVEGERPFRFAASRAQVLLAYLALNRYEHRRETLATLLWDDREHRQALANLRSLLAQLPPGIKPYLTITRRTLALDETQPLWVDAIAFRQALKHALESADETAEPAALETALALYRGPFLAGVFARESRGLEEWTAVTRERLHQLAIAGHDQLATHYLHYRQIGRALPHARALVQLDPLREQSQRLLMRLLARDGQYNAALRQYQQCQQLLQDELGVSPAPETERLYQRIDRSRQPPPHRLLPQFTPFIGRTHMLAAIGQRLDDPDCRLLTLMGPGGAGKTRLALQAADDRRGEYLDGIYVVPLAGVERAADLPLAVIQRLDFSPDGEDPLAAQLAAHLQAREMLLVLDNFEQLIPAGVPLLQTILAQAPDVKLLLTSRQRLKLQAEWVLPVTGMTVEMDQEVSEAVALFRAVACRVQPDFVLDAETKTAVSQIGHLLEGLPLGIELAAAALPDHSPTQIVAALRHTLDVLTSPLRDVPERHRSLRAAFIHSWELLSATEQTSFARLAVFRGSFSPAAAIAVASASPALLRALQAKSLLQPAGDGRYVMHEVLRQYAAEKLATRGEEKVIRGRHAHFFADFLAARDTDLDGSPRQLEALAELERERENVTAGWQWTIKHGDEEQLGHYVAGLQHWFRLRGLYHEGEATFAAAIDSLRQQPSLSSQQEVVLAHLLAHYGFYLFRLVRYQAACTHLQESVTLLRRHQLPQKMVKPLGGLANAAFMQGEMAEAERRYQELLTLCRRLERINGIAGSLEGLGLVADAQGKYDEAIDFLEESLALRREEADSHALANLLGNLAAVYENKNDFTEAIRLSREALTLWEKFGDTYSQIITLANLGECQMYQGNLAQAEETYHRVLVLSQESNQAIGQPTAYWGKGEIQRRRGHLAQAVAAYRLSWETAVRDFHKVRTLFGYAQVLATRGDESRAAGLLALVRDHSATIDVDRKKAEALLATLPPPPAAEVVVDLDTIAIE